MQSRLRHEHRAAGQESLQASCWRGQRLRARRAVVGVCLLGRGLASGTPIRCVDGCGESMSEQATDGWCARRHDKRPSSVRRARREQVAVVDDGRCYVIPDTRRWVGLGRVVEVRMRAIVAPPRTFTFVVPPPCNSKRQRCGIVRAGVCKGRSKSRSSHNATARLSFIWPAADLLASA